MPHVQGMARKRPPVLPGQGLAWKRHSLFVVSRSSCVGAEGVFFVGSAGQFFFDVGSAGLLLLMSALRAVTHVGSA